MSQQIIIIGLGHFGMSLAKTLAARQVEVIATDIRKQLVDEASLFVSDAVLMDASDEQALANLRPKDRDAAVCAIGDDSKEASIIATALLRQMGCPYVIARANDEIHARILRLVGAHLVVNPEQEFGNRFANRLLYRNVIADTALHDGLTLTEITVHNRMAGKTLAELQLPKKYGVLVVGIRSVDSPSIVQPLPDVPLNKTDTLLVVSDEKNIINMIKSLLV
jgi:trk system potassium uptake protein TrkA